MNALRTMIAAAGLLLMLVAPQGAPRAEEAADQFDCAACHPMKIRDFKGRRANPVTPVEEFPELPSGTQDVASSPAMCFSCHDGFVMDSRAMWEGGYRGHRVGMAPPPDMVIPELGGAPEFKLNEDGNVYCGTCHSAHLNEADGAPTEVEPFMRQAADGGNICTACHADKLAIDEAAVHGPGIEGHMILNSPKGWRWPGVSPGNFLGHLVPHKDIKIGRLSIDKTFHGDLKGTSQGEMLSAMTDAEGSAGYVAIEHVSGVLQGRYGTFALQHFGIMDRGENRLVLEVVPQSGSGELASLSGTMTISQAGDKHYYALDYELEE